MAKQNAKTAAPRANDDSVVYKVMIAVILAIIGVTVFSRIRNVYSTAGGFVSMRPALATTAWITAALTVIFAAAGSLLRSRKVLCYTMGFACAVSLVTMICCVMLRVYWVNAAVGCYFLWIAAALLYALYLLYQHEFFAIALLTAVAAAAFYAISHAPGAAITVLLVIVLIVLCVLVAALTFLLAKNDGVLQFGKKQLQVFSRGFAAFPLYIVSVLWALCAVVALILGGVFAYYCIYAAVGVALVAVCYYTLKLM